VPYLSALEVCVHDEALYKSTFTFTFTLTEIKIIIIIIIIIITISSVS